MATGTGNKITIWVVTTGGLQLARRIQSQRPGATIRCSPRLALEDESADLLPFQGLSQTLETDFHTCDGHIFIMAAGIVVRAIAPWLKHKTVDPAVVVVDDQGQYAISLLSGHIGGANALAVETAALLNARPVVTTATDVNAKPAIDMIAVQQDLAIENPDRIKAVNMALLNEAPIAVHDPYALITENLASIGNRGLLRGMATGDESAAGVYVDDVGKPDTAGHLVLRPSSLVAGIGCNRHTSMEEIKDLLETACNTHGVSLLSLQALASIDVKNDEAGLLRLSELLHIPIRFFSRQQLNQVRHVPNPSAMVEKHVGVPSVCEAAAILAAGQGRLIVPKQKTRNVTLAIARHSFLSSASAPEA